MAIDLNNIQNWLNNNQGVLALIGIILVIIGWVSGFFKWIFRVIFGKKDINRNISARGSISAGGDIIAGDKHINNHYQTNLINSHISELPDIDIRMKSNYRVNNPKGTVFAELTTGSHSNIAKFKFIDSKYEDIGRFSKFYKILRTDNEMVSNYFIETEADREKFLKTLYEQEGKIDAIVSLTSGEKYIYTFEAQGDNWKVSIEQNHPNLQDTFIIISKTRFLELSKESNEILLELVNSGTSQINILSTDQTGDFVRIGKRDFIDSQEAYLEGLNELLDNKLVSHKSGNLYELTALGLKEAQKIPL